MAGGLYLLSYDIIRSVLNVNTSFFSSIFRAKRNRPINARNSTGLNTTTAVAPHRDHGRTPPKLHSRHPVEMASLQGSSNNDPESPTPGTTPTKTWFQELNDGIEGTIPALSLPNKSALKGKLLDLEETEFMDGETVSVTLQLEMFAMIFGLRQQIVTLTNTVEELSTTVKNLSNKTRDLSTNMVASAAKTAPQISIMQRQQPCLYAEAAAPSEGQTPTTPAKGGKKRSGPIGPTPPKNPKTKMNKDGKETGSDSAATNQPIENTVRQPKTINVAR